MSVIRIIGNDTMRVMLIAVGGMACRWVDPVQDHDGYARLGIAAGGEYATLAREADLEVAEIGAGTKPRPFCWMQESWSERAVQDDAKLMRRRIRDAV